MTWLKACECKSMATTGMLRVSERQEGNVIHVTVRFEPGPSCDECGTPWVLEAPVAGR